MTPYAAFITAFLFVGTVGTVATLLALGLGRAAARPLPLPHPDAPDAEFEAWVMQALAPVRADRAAHIAKHEAAAFDPDAVDWNERSGA